MEESLSGTSSELKDEDVDRRSEEFAAVVAHRDELMEMLKWNAAIVAVLIEEAGGMVEIKSEDLQKIDLNKVNATVEYNAERELYIVRGVYDNDEV